MKAQLPEVSIQHGRNLQTDKELVDGWSMVVLDPVTQTLKTVIHTRCWMGRSRTAQTVYASIWVNDRRYTLSGYGTAGGYGYHKQSAALGEAIRSAGITLDEDINGRGERAIEHALEAIARAMGYDIGHIVSI